MAKGKRFTLTFDDAELERAFRHSMAVRYQRSIALASSGVVAFFGAFLVFAATGEDPVITVTRIATLLVLVPAATFCWVAGPATFTRWMPVAVGVAATAIALYFGVVVRTLQHVPEAVTTNAAGMVLMPIVTCLVTQLRVVAALLVGAAVSLAVGAIYATVPYLSAAAIAGYWMLVAMSLGVGMLGAHGLEAGRRRDFVQSRALEAEQARSERLLHNVLPSQVVERLKDRPGTIAERFDEATVLFADIVGFTALAEQLDPERLVAVLDEIFSNFDDIAERHGLEKIKTIGDAYMVVGGVPTRGDDHVAAVANMALEMRAYIAGRASEAPLQLRVGVHSGPVVAGVIGKRKFIFDVWGDTVNMASRMESHGIPGEIQITCAVHERIGKRFRTTERGVIDVKGKGEVATYFLIAKADA